MEVRMSLMRFLQNLKSKFLILTLLSTMTVPAFAQAKVAVVNLVRIYQEYSLVEEANDQITEGEKGLKRVIATAEAEMRELESKTDAASQKKRDEIQLAVDTKVEEVQDIKENYNMKINRNIQTTIDKLAIKKNYIAVLDKSFSVFAADDITTEILTELEKIK